MDANKTTTIPIGDFANDIAFLQMHTPIILLTEGKSRVAVSPQYQARLMTSTTHYENGKSFGWLNKKVIKQGFLSEKESEGKIESQIYIFGGEERFWLGPEGGQFSFFFKPDATFEFCNWKTPSAIDTATFTLLSQTETTAAFEHICELVNKSGTLFKIGISRTIRILNQAHIEEIIQKKISEKVAFVAYQTDNQIANIGDKTWLPQTGLPAIWILGMYNPSPDTTMIIPFKEGEETVLGEKINGAYFGKVPEENILVKENVVFFKGDGSKRSKIGVSPKRSKGIAGSYDAKEKVLTLITYNIQDAPHGYVNSAWAHQETPYDGDVINAYNDGSPAVGVLPLGPFYELETSSPAAALQPGETMQHIQTTIHLQGDEVELDEISKIIFGISLQEIVFAFRDIH